MTNSAKSLRKLRFATFYCIVTFFILVGLGTWQMLRLQWKLNLVHTIEQQVALPAVALPNDPNISLQEWQYRKIKVQGAFLHEHEVTLYTGPKVLNGDIGYNLLTPFKTDQGVIVLVDRGWVPYQKKEQVNRPETLPNGAVELVAMLQDGETPGRFTPKNDPERHMWFWIDIGHMLKGINSGNVITNFYLRQLKESDQPGLPVAGEAKVHYRNDHLQYAITWYSLAVILIIVYGAFRRQVIRNNS